VGSAIGEALETFRVPYLVIEIDPDVINGLRTRGVPCLFGDAGQERLLEEAGARRASLTVVALPELERAHSVVRTLRKINPGVPILARVHTMAGRERLLRAGATEVIQPELEGAAALIRHALDQLSLPAERVGAYLERFHQAMEMSGERRAPTRDALPEVRDVQLRPGALADQSLRQARVRERFGVTVVAIIRADGDLTANPPPDTILRPGDRIRLCGLPDQIDAFRSASESEDQDAL
jgi:CPA2 family monovalent cation:H+ antiporter-2